MILYHSSLLFIPNPDITFSREFLDFGKGFYLTSLHDQAVKYARRFLRRQQKAWINTYQLTFEESDWKILRFERYDKAWLDFVSMCRAGEDNTDYDMVCGGVANDQVIQTLDRYFEGELSVDDTLGLLKYEKPNNQYCIRSQAMIVQCIKHLESKPL